MIRNIVGTCLDVAMGRVDILEVERLLEGKGRVENKSKPAKPHGLCLEEVFFEE